ncbi:MAG: PhoH family protein [Corynebacterium flavescens]|uniref:PhoH family protein n=1 Tax=Corynebacterium flavescens TaxID=28028 RepID=UPI002649A9DE|nr:PhoH family protein [Corynebacterium flavescens]MDN6236179.1 PhoH family protein [Corynebacterium flavescens]
MTQPKVLYRPQREGRVATTTFVIDPSVLLSDPWALKKFAEHEVVLPIVVISELEAKRHHPELGWFARQALRFLEDLRSTYDALDQPVPVNLDGGTLRVELNHQDQSLLPEAFRGSGGDQRILACALNLAREGKDTVLVTKDVPLRVKAGAVGLSADEYHAQDVVLTGYTGTATAFVSPADIDELFRDGEVNLDEVVTTTDIRICDLPVHCGITLNASGQSALGRVTAEGTVRLVHGDTSAFGLRGRAAEQRLALDLLMDPEVGIVSIGGRAGTGKSALALCAGLEAVFERGEHRKIIVFRPMYAVGGQDLGYLPGSEAEKMNPWAQAVYDTLDGLVSSNVMEEVLDRGLIEVLPLTHIRGRSLHDAFVIIDEAQSLERNVLLTVLSRLGRGSRVVLTHDVAQRDNLRVGRHDGVQAVIEKLKGHELFAHVTLQRSERSRIAELITDLLEGDC